VPQEWLNIAAVIIAAVALLTSFIRTARVQGADRQRIEAVEGRLTNLATIESVTALACRVDDQERDLKEMSQALNQVGIIATKVDGLDRLVTREMDEIKHTLRKLEERSFSPAPGRPAKAVS
jgi:Flp pilus assembly protein TadB